MPEKKPLLRCDPDLLVAGRLRLLSQPAMLAEPTRVMQCVFEAERLVDLAGKLNHFAVEFERLIRKTEVPQSQRQIAAMSDAGILAQVSGPEGRALAIVELGDRARTAIAGTGKIAPIEPCQTLQEESLHQDSGIVESLAKLHGFIRQLAANAEVAAHDMKREITPHHREELRLLAHPLAQSAGAMEYRTDFRRRIPARSDVSSAERTEQLQLAGITLGRRFQRFKQS